MNDIVGARTYLNSISIVGNIASEPKFFSTEGSRVCTFVVATNTRVKASGGYTMRQDYHKIIVKAAGLVDLVCSKLKKRTAVLVIGSMTYAGKEAFIEVRAQEDNKLVVLGAA